MPGKNPAAALLRAALALGLLVIPGLAQWLRGRRGVSLVFVGPFCLTVAVAIVANRAQVWAPLQVLLWLTLVLIAAASTTDAYRYEQRHRDERRRWLAAAFRRLPYR